MPPPPPHSIPVPCPPRGATVPMCTVRVMPSIPGLPLHGDLSPATQCSAHVRAFTRVPDLRRSHNKEGARKVRHRLTAVFRLQDCLAYVDQVLPQLEEAGDQ